LFGARFEGAGRRDWIRSDCANCRVACAAEREGRRQSAREWDPACLVRYQRRERPRYDAVVQLLGILL